VIKPNNPNSEFQLGGINHVALVCSDMERTVDFYSNVLGMPLIKSLDLPGGMGQHFFFDAGSGDCVAFFWFADAPDRVPGVSSPEAIPGIGDIVSAVSTMNHLAFHVPAEKFDEYRKRLKEKGVRVGPVLNHDESAAQVSPTVHPGETGEAIWRTFTIGDLRVRQVEYTPGYLADHWCDLGHVLYVLEGELDTELRDGRTFKLLPGMSYQVSNEGDAPHRSSTRTGAKLFIVD